MEQENKTFGAGPTLTLEPELDMSAPQNPPLMEAKPEMDPVQKEMAQTVLSREEQQMVDAFAEKIDVENINQILSYGAGTQKKMAEFSRNWERWETFSLRWWASCVILIRKKKKESSDFLNVRQIRSRP